MFTQKEPLYLIVKKCNYTNIHGIFSSCDEAKKAISLFGNLQNEYIIYTLYLNEYIHDYFLNVKERVVKM